MVKRVTIIKVQFIQTTSFYFVKLGLNIAINYPLKENIFFTGVPTFLQNLTLIHKIILMEDFPYHIVCLFYFCFKIKLS